MFKYNEIIERLLNEIHETPAHSKLPSRYDLCVRFHCTRTTIDRAISELIVQGYLYSRQGSGTYVAPSGMSYPRITRTWALIVPDINFPLYSLMLRGVTDEANKAGAGVQIYFTDDDPSRQRSIIRNLVHAKIDGFIIVPTTVIEPQYEIFLWLTTQNIPFVFCNRGIEEVLDAPLVCSNAFYGGYKAVKHLFQKGYKRPAFISHRFYRLPMDRMEGYMAAVCEEKSQLRRDYVVPSCAVAGTDDPRKPFAYQEVQRLLQLSEPPDSIFCSSEFAIEGVYKAVQEAGMRIPADFGVITHDNTPLCLQQFPNVTAVELDCYEIGRQAAMVLQKIMENKTSPGFNLHILHPELIERQSCLGPGVEVYRDHFNQGR